jgi:hypothetical protein
LCVALLHSFPFIYISIHFQENINNDNNHNDDAINNTADDNRRYNNDHGIIPPYVFEEPIIVNDAENVHDHSVQADIQQNIDNLLLRYCIDTQEIQDVLKDIEAHIHTYKKNITVDIYKRCMFTIQHLNGQKGLYNITEKHALVLVWYRLCELLSLEDAVHILIINLSENAILTDSGEYIQLCNTGRFSRIINILAGVDDTYCIRPLWALKSEWNYLVPLLKKEWFLLKEIDETKYDNQELLNINTVQKELREYIFTEIQKRHIYIGLTILKNVLQEYLENV